ncbi:MAG: hypothetical protein WC262_08520 [Bacteroidales bacterium]|jgi:hypothetical protein
MKHYKKTYEDVYHAEVDDVRLARMGSLLGSPEKLAEKFRAFYKDFHESFFGYVVKQVWLEQHFSYNGVRRSRRSQNGYVGDWAFSYFMKMIVGYSQKPLTVNFLFTAIATYLKDFFPDFLNHDPFAEPEYFKFPYENITLDHLFFVYMVDNRLELLEEAEKKKMSFFDFANWATNAVFCYNDDVNKDVYVLTNNRFFWAHLKKLKTKRGWSEDKFNFDLSPTIKK